MMETPIPHTFKKYDGELSNLHLIVLEMGEVALRQLSAALAAVEQGDVASAARIIDEDAELNRLEVMGDAEIFRVIAENAPMASDLRLVIAVSKSISDLEQLGDEAVRIASLLLDLNQLDASSLTHELLTDLDEVGNLALDHLKLALSLFEDWDQDQAHHVIDGYRQMDAFFRRELKRVMTAVLDGGVDLNLAVSVVLVTKSLDRVAHHSLNIAEYAMFAMSGEDLREI